MSFGVALLAAALAGGAAPVAPAAPARVERRVELMGTTLAVAVDGVARGRGLALAETAVRALEQTEARLTTWGPASELQALNRAPVGAPVPLSAPAWRALAGALACAERTGGAFDPTVAPLVAAWGLRRGGRTPGGAELAAARAAVGAAAIELDAATRSVRKRAPRTIEEGGFGKGAGLDDALDAVERARAPLERGRVRLDLGGQLAWTGAGAAEAVALADPRRRGRALLELRLAGQRGSLASSGTSERGRHLLDPASGRPAPDFGSVAVVAPSALAADCLSTALYVLGPEAGERWLAGPGRGVEAVFLIVEPGGVRARATAELAGRLRALAPEVRIERMPDSS